MITRVVEKENLRSGDVLHWIAPIGFLKVLVLMAFMFSIGFLYLFFRMIFLDDM